MATAVRDVDLAISGMHCASCVGRVEGKLNELAGVEATVNLATEEARVRVLEPNITDEALIAAVEAAGYQASRLNLDDDREADAAAELAVLQRRLLVALGLSIPVVAVSMIPALQFRYWQWVLLALATPVIVWCAAPFHIGAVRALRNRTTTMDTLISVGTLAAFAYSLWSLVFGNAGEAGLKMRFEPFPAHQHSDHIYFEVAAGVTALVLLGRYLEAKARSRAGSALRSLLHLGAKDVVLLTDTGEEQRVPIERLRVGHRFAVRPGERIATDGVVDTGDSAVDLSLLTGESAPVEVTAGSAVTGATINLTGYLVVRATKVGADTALAQIGRLVRDAQTGKAAVQRLADRISRIFVPAVILLAAATLVGWLLAGRATSSSFAASVAVLIIACPCALGLATPTALMVGTGRAAQLGIIIRGIEVLENTKRIDTVVLDKTGTVTTGRMSLVDVTSLDPEALQLAGAVESMSEHPIARAIADAARAEGLLPPVTQFESKAAFGVQGVVEGRQVWVGKSEGELPTELAETVDRARSNGHTTAVVAIDDDPVAVLAIADTLKPTSVAAVERFKQLGLKAILLTGDNEAVARSVAAQIGTDDVIAGVLPTGKVDVVKRLQGGGRTVAMVGDGVNDAAALAQADLGIAMGTGTDVAIEASDLTVMSGDLQSVADGIELSRRTLRVIISNLFWAFAYNVAAIPLAMSGRLNPVIAGAAMAFSSVFVVMNSLRLRRFKPHRR